jgi:hypothetical protein
MKDPLLPFFPGTWAGHGLYVMIIMPRALEMALIISHSRPEPNVHGAAYDDAPSQGKGVENPLHHGRYGIEPPIHHPKPLRIEHVVIVFS